MAMQAGPLMWDRVHAYHNPMTGSYHSPPSSALFGLEGEPLHVSSPPNIFPYSSASTPERRVQEEREWRPPPRDGMGESTAGKMDALKYFCAMCCPSLVTTREDREKELMVR
mmetsp:Transcript_94361/g.149224  ORF Transcript_94361/g.149224 Transcript_94361/m.149224 type:complete len:112 (-) Transcript_94361:209-544(-)|eukprot:CAMPEP_0169138166 /NCGR_PEP_ID=MMETSP1015-20121227/42044_1 /TAXON_ID=342587 /ORGANISM="Karlodinium micrum, Strain CCMP2283" /LENGTH=111 /DNA_ID=CAMNT_0009203293 /DNA_START=71 /DNA_END=406 /DNA_ORIENTATION=+